LRRGELSALWREARARARLCGESLSGLLLAAGYHATPAALRERLYQRRMSGQYPLSITGAGLCRGAVRFHGADTGRGGLLDRYLLDCIRRWALPHILRQDDRNAMAFGIESRAPYLDYRLAELAFRVPAEVRLAQGYTKRLLRDIGEGLMPEEVRLRPDKIGFWSPRQQFLTENQALVREVAGTLPHEVAELSDVTAWRDRLDRFYRGDGTQGACVWGGFISSLWVRRTLPRLRAAAGED